MTAWTGVWKTAISRVSGIKERIWYRWNKETQAERMRRYAELARNKRMTERKKLECDADSEVLGSNPPPT
jgi:RPA family protein